MDTEFLINQGNEHRSNRMYSDALQCYALAFAQDYNSAAAFNNYGNVLREIGYPQRAIPFLHHAMLIEPNNVTAKFNLAVSLLLMGDYKQGFPAYESRWDYEHLAGTLPKFSQPRWRGEDLKDKTILVVGEQGHGDNIQFSRFLFPLHAAGARVKFQVTDALVPLFKPSPILETVCMYNEDPGAFDYWTPIMSIPTVMGMGLDNLPKNLNYLNADAQVSQQWLERLGPKTKLRIGFSWSGRRDAWLNQHKGMPFEVILEFIKKHPQYEWINLQVDATEEESTALEAAGVRLFPGTIRNFNDTTGVMAHCDIVLSVDTAVAHLAGALGRPTWIMLQKFGVDWRWLLDRTDSPWYSTARLFRQQDFDDWASVLNKVSQYLSWYKV